MSHLNVEIKARCKTQAKIIEILSQNHAEFKGTDHQIDTYFKVPHGRLKLREGSIENYLIFYERSNQEGPKQSKVVLFKNEPDSSLKEILTRSLDTLVIVDKEREIYFIENVKFHIDRVKDLGTFMEIEARDPKGTIGEEELLAQVEKYRSLFEITDSDLVSLSYSDLLRAQNDKNSRTN